MHKFVALQYFEQDECTSSEITTPLFEGNGALHSLQKESKNPE